RTPGIKRIRRSDKIVEVVSPAGNVALRVIMAEDPCFPSPLESMRSPDIRQAGHETIVVIPGKNPASRSLGSPEGVKVVRDNGGKVFPGDLIIQRGRQPISRQVGTESRWGAIVMEANIVEAYIQDPRP